MTHVWGLAFPSRVFGFLGQLPGNGLPIVILREILVPHQEHMYSTFVGLLSTGIALPPYVYYNTKL